MKLHYPDPDATFQYWQIREIEAYPGREVWDQQAAYGRNGHFTLRGLTVSSDGCGIDLTAYSSQRGHPLLDKLNLETATALRDALTGAIEDQRKRLLETVQTPS